MRITLVCSALLFVCFIQTEAACLAEMTMSDMIEIRQFHQNMKSYTKPFGCLNIKPGPEVIMPYIECFKEMAGEFRNETIQNDKIELPSFKDALGNFTECLLEKYDLIVDDEFDLQRYISFYDSVTYMEPPSPEDLAILNGAIKECTETVQLEKLSPVRDAMALEKCIFRQIIDRCTEDRGAKSVGALLPIIYALNSLFDGNTDCDSAEINQTIKGEFIECFKKEDSSSEVGQITMSENPMENVVNFFKCFKEIKGEFIECFKIEDSEEGQIIMSGNPVENVMNFFKCFKEIKGEFMECFKIEDSYFEEGQMTMSGNPMENVMNFLKCFKEIPEIECLIKLSDTYGLRDEGNTNFQAVADYVVKLVTRNPDLKDRAEAITKCGDVNADIAWWERDIEFGTCFLPAYADICGLDNNLSSKVLFPLLDEEFLNSFLNRINEKFDLIGLMKLWQ